MIGAVIQARMGSTRLPGKVLMDLCGKPVLEHVIERVRAVRGLDMILVATSKEARDAPIAELCQNLRVPCYRGDEQDVLDRYFRAAALHRLTAVVRITADCPLLDPAVVQEVIDQFGPGVDYCSNVHPPTYPDGLDVEVISILALERAWCEAADPFEREHVTPYLWRRPFGEEHPDGFRLKNVAAETDRSYLRWTVDTAADLEHVRVLMTRQGTSTDYRKLL